MSYHKAELKKTNILKTFCHACLSADRVIFPLGEFIEIFRKICEEAYQTSKSEVYMCWECIAVLRKIKLFKTKVDDAQWLLKSHKYFKETNNFPNSLTNLNITKIDTETPLIVFDEEKPLEIKPDFTVKQESDCINNDCNDIDYQDTDYQDSNYQETIYQDTDYTRLEDIKAEDQILAHKIKKECGLKKRHSKKYRMIFHPDQEKIVSKMPIGHHELDSWLERERNSSFFTSLKRKCDRCLCKLSRNEGVKEHDKKFHDETIGQFPCDVCQTRFTTKCALSTHTANHYFIQSCNICSFKCYAESHMMNHIVAHKKTVQCIDCRACYNNVRQFFTHYKAMHRIFLCDHCSKRCNTKRILEKHIRRNHLTLECKDCNLVFKTYSTLHKHRELKHVTACTEDAFCVQCNKQFNNVVLYKRHLKTSIAHANERRNANIKKEKVQCPECSNVYSRRIYMMNHFRHVHVKASKFYCEECDKHFLNRTRYRDHRRYNHEGFVKEKDKLCNICGRGFAENRTLTNHMRTHSGERPYVCSYCDSKFTQKQALQSHVKFIHLKCRRKNLAFLIPE